VQKLSAQPDYFRASWNDDPATTMVIGWSNAEGTLHWGPTDQGTNFANYPNATPFQDSVRIYGIINFFVKLSGLTPKTTYYAVVRDPSGNVSRRLKFRTMSDNPDDPISFVSAGDTRDAAPIVESCNCIAERRAIFTVLSKVCADFITFSGDFTNGKYPGQVNIQRQWRDWFEDWQRTISADGRLIPIVPALGNHEEFSDKVIFKFFNIPLTNNEEFFAMSFGGNLLRIYSLNSERTELPAQISWFENDAQLYSQPGNQVFWKAVQYHKPVASQGNPYANQPETKFKENFVSKFATYGVRLAMEGHTHIYKVSWPVLPLTTNNTSRNGFFRNDTIGTIYIGEGNFGAPFRTVNGGPDNLYAWTREARTNFTSFFYINVTKERMDVRTVMNKNNASLSNQVCDQQGVPLRADAYIFREEDGARNGSVVIIPPFGQVSAATPVIQNVLLDLGSVYPNPVKNNLNVELKQFSGIKAIEVYDFFGRMRRQVLNPTQVVTSFDMTNLESGVYSVFIRSTEGVQSIKVVKP
jgi:hypothetical protein